MNNYFTHSNGITTLTHDAPDWLVTAVYSAHNGEMPNEWVYHACAVIADTLAEDGDVEEAIGTLQDTYTVDALDWLRGNIYRIGYCDDALSEGIVPDPQSTISIILAGQYIALRIIADEMEMAYQENVLPA